MFPENFARKALLVGGSYADSDGQMAVYEEYLIFLLNEEGIIGEEGNLDAITDLYYPENGFHYCEPYYDDFYFESQVQLSRSSAISELDNGFNLVLHNDHSGTHQIGAAQNAGDYIFEYDLPSFANCEQPSILWTGGCWSGHFEGADCFAERGLISSSESGFVSIIAFSREGHSYDWELYYPFIDALYPFGWVTEYDPGSGVSYIGEALRYSKNYENSYWDTIGNAHKCEQNHFGDPSMFV